MNDDKNNGDYSYRAGRIKDLYSEEPAIAEYQSDAESRPEGVVYKTKLSRDRKIPKRLVSQAFIVLIAGGIIAYNNYDWLFPETEIESLNYSNDIRIQSSGKGTVAPFSQPRPKNFKTKWGNPTLSFKDKYFCRGFQTSPSCDKERLLHPLAQEYIRQGKEVPTKEYKNSRVIREIIKLD